MIDLSRTGVYCITNTRSGLRYVGSAAWSFAKRWSKHKSDLRLNRHTNPRLQNIWNKYGEGSLVFRVLRYCDPSECLEYEQRFIDHFDSTNKALGYNMAPKAGHTRGIKMSPETRAKMSASKRGRKRPPVTDEARKNMAAAQRGKKRGPLSDEVKKKLSIAKMGKQTSAESRAKMSAAKKGKRQSDDVIARQAESRRGRKATQEHRDKIAAALRGKPKSFEHRQNLAAANRGKRRGMIASQLRMFDDGLQTN